MFGLSKSERIKKLWEEVEEEKKHASHIYKFKENAEERAFSELCNLAFKKNLPPNVVAKSPEGVSILAQVVLNRQFAFYLNEKAIQTYAKIFNLQNERDTHDSEEWLEQVVKKAGWEVVSAEIPTMCSNLIDDADSYFSQINKSDDN